MGAQPLGEPAPADGVLPASAADQAGDRDFGIYLHVPFCSVRCGYCDFNTYTATELRGVQQSSYADTAQVEIALADRVLTELATHNADVRRSVSTVFLGGGTPTLLPPTDLAAMLSAIRDTWGLVDGAEITTEANPDSIDANGMQVLADAGFTRVSLGMQSAVPHVLAALDRTHDPARVPQAVAWAKDAGVDVSVDLIYGAPGESIDDWRCSVDAALDLDVDHISAYALIVEEETALARRIRRGEQSAVDDDLQADMYELADERFAAAGYRWYEMSNWARNGAVSRHNVAYWRGQDWWGIGPGAHSHIGGVRWWNVKHPAAYADRLQAGLSPARAREVLDADTRYLERVLLETRMAEGLPISVLQPSGRQSVEGLVADGLIDEEAALQGRIVPTLTGRLLADVVVRRLTPT